MNKRSLVVVLLSEIILGSCGGTHVSASRPQPPPSKPAPSFGLNASSPRVAGNGDAGISQPPLGNESAETAQSPEESATPLEKRRRQLREAIEQQKRDRPNETLTISVVDGGRHPVVGEDLFEIQEKEWGKYIDVEAHKPLVGVGVFLRLQAGYTRVTTADEILNRYSTTHETFADRWSEIDPQAILKGCEGPARAAVPFSTIKLKFELELSASGEVVSVNGGDAPEKRLRKLCTCITTALQNKKFSPAEKFEQFSMLIILESGALIAKPQS